MFCTSVNTYQDMDALRCKTTTYTNGHTEQLSVVLYQSTLSDYSSCAKRIVDHCINNSFQTINFDYEENGYPSTISAKVYLTEHDFDKGNVAFEMTYRPDVDEAKIFNYDIKNNSENFIYEFN